MKSFRCLIDCLIFRTVLILRLPVKQKNNRSNCSGTIEMERMRRSGAFGSL